MTETFVAGYVCVQRGNHQSVMKLQRRLLNLASRKMRFLPRTQRPMSRSSQEALASVRLDLAAPL